MTIELAGGRADRNLQRPWWAGQADPGAENRSGPFGRSLYARARYALSNITPARRSSSARHDRQPEAQRTASVT
ncbi:MAG: hypothetical protein U0559_01855 [Anaerolineae bacterium]